MCNICATAAITLAPIVIAGTVLVLKNKNGRNKGKD